MIFLQKHKKYITNLMFAHVEINTIRVMYSYVYDDYNNAFYYTGNYETEIEFNDYSELTKIAVRNKKGRSILYVTCYLDYDDDSLPDDIEPDDRPWLYDVAINTKPPSYLQKLYNNPIKSYSTFFTVAGEKIKIARVR